VERIAIAQRVVQRLMLLALRVYTLGNMAATAKKRAPLVVQSVIRRKAGFKGGEDLKFKASGEVIAIVRKPLSPRMNLRLPNGRSSMLGWQKPGKAPTLDRLRRLMKLLRLFAMKSGIERQ
jgi:hypothetical protein